MTISVPTNLELVSTNVVDNTDVFNNTIYQPYPLGTKYQENDIIYENVLADFTPPIYDIADTYAVNQIVYKDSLVKKVDATTGLVIKQPEEYTAVDTSFDNTLWSNRYMKLLDIPTGVNAYDKNISSYTPYVGDFTFSQDGTKMYQVDSTLDKIYQYSLSTAWDIATAVYSKQITTYTARVTDFTFSQDGTKMYQLDSDVKKISQLHLSTAWDIATAVYSKQITTYTPSTVDFAFSQDGTKMYQGNIHLNTIFQHSLSTAWDISTAVYSKQITTSSEHVNDFTFSQDGTKMYQLDSYGAYAANKIYQYSLSTAWDISTAVYSKQIAQHTIDVNALKFSQDGTKMYQLDNNVERIYQLHLSTAWDIATAKYSLLPFTKTEVRLGNTYIYTLTQSGGIYTFKSSVNGIESSSVMNNHIDLTESSAEDKAYIAANTTWVAKTLITRPTAWYIRTSLDMPVETQTITDYQFSTVVSPSQLTGFTNMGATVQHAPFDDKNYSIATATTTMTYTVQGLVKFDTISLGRVKADTATIVFTLPVASPDYALWLNGVAVLSGGNGIVTTTTRTIESSRDEDDNLEDWYTTEIFYSAVPMDIDSTVSITLTRATGEIVELGTILLGMSVNAGFTHLEMNHSYKDFSIAEYDVWGNLDYVERQRILTYKGNVSIPITSYDRIVRLMSSLGKQLVIVNGSTSKTIAPDSQSVFASTQIIGRFMSFDSNTKIKDGDMDKLAVYSFSLEELA